MLKSMVQYEQEQLPKVAGESVEGWRWRASSAWIADQIREVAPTLRDADVTRLADLIANELLTSNDLAETRGREAGPR